MNSSGATIVALLLLALTLPPESEAITWRVKTDGELLQDVVDGAAEGDTVLVDAGIYPGPLNIATRLTVLGASPTGDDTAKPVIDAGGHGRGFSQYITSVVCPGGVTA